MCRKSNNPTIQLTCLLIVYRFSFRSAFVGCFPNRTVDSPRRRKMDGATRGGTAEPTSREQNTRQERAWGRKEIEKVARRTSWKNLARKRRRRGRAERRRLQQNKRRNRARARGREIAVATHNVRTMAVDGTHGVGRALDVLSMYDRLGCDIIGLQETRRSGQSAFNQAGYLVYCSGECGGENDGKKG